MLCFTTPPWLVGIVLCVAFAPAWCLADDVPVSARPNILFCIADDWGWPHASAYGDPVVQTPHFDRLAREGVLFHHAYISSPSCTPSRGAILTGQDHWRLEGAGNLWSIFPDHIPTYPEMLAESGYFVGVTSKGWGPGRTATEGRPLAGRRFPGFAEFLTARPAGVPFCFWLGSSDPHRPYDPGSGAASGMDLNAIRLEACFPDHEIVRNDVADYYFEVQRFDSLVGEALALLEQSDLLDQTIIVMTSDHGMPFPRCKGNLYDTGTRVPLAIRWPPMVPGGRESIDFVSLVDLAPTFLELAGVEVPGGGNPSEIDHPGEMTGRSLLSLLTSSASGQIDPARTEIIFGKERHVPCQESPDMGGYPCRAIRTHEHLLIWNITPDRWPAGTPHWERAAIRGVWLGDCDNGPTKTYMVEHQHADADHARLYDLAFGMRPAFEFYDLRHDPHQLDNLLEDDPQLIDSQVVQSLRERLMKRLTQTGDPRLVGGWEVFEKHPYFGSGPRHPDSEME